MSLVIVKVNKEAKTHSIYSEGICCCGDDIVSNTQEKFNVLKSDGYNILVGTTGVSSFGCYIRRHFLDNFSVKEYVETEEWSGIVEYLTNVYINLYGSFCKKFSISDSKSAKDHPTDIILSVNGKIIVVNQRDSGIIDVEDHSDEEYYAIGCGDTNALCLLDAGVDVKDVFRIVSRRCKSVNDKVQQYTCDYLYN